MRTLVIGGAASGKSALAESLAAQGHAPRLYVATMEPAGTEARERIARHRALRAGGGFATLEWARGLACAPLPESAHGGTALLECLGTLVANEMFAPPAYAARPETDVLADVLAGVGRLERACADVVVVSNDVGRAGPCVGADAGTQAYARVLAQANARLAEWFERVVEVVFGVAIWQKGGGGR